MSDTTSTNTDDGLEQQIPATITAGESPAAAIADEARTVADKQAEVGPPLPLVNVRARRLVPLFDRVIVAKDDA
jgi:hypothetical protein